SGAWRIAAAGCRAVAATAAIAGYGGPSGNANACGPAGAFQPRAIGQRSAIATADQCASCARGRVACVRTTTSGSHQCGAAACGASAPTRAGVAGAEPVALIQTMASADQDVVRRWWFWWMCAAFPDHHVTEPLVESLRFDKGADGARAIAPLAHVLDGLDQRGDGHAPPRGEGAEPLPCLRIKADAGFAAADDHRMFA